MKFFIFFIFFYTISSTVINVSENHTIKSSVESEFRKSKNKERDKYRNPEKTLNFFGLKRDLRVLEIIPGRGWYTEIIGNFMKNTGNYYVAVYEEPSYATEIITKIQNDFLKYFNNNKEKFGDIQSLNIDKNFRLQSKKEFFDLILTFRNTHNFLDQNKFNEIYKSINKSLKKGGILGIVQHRSDEDSEFDFKKGYVKESFLIKRIEELGFKLLDKSEINSNPKDVKNYKKGVWTLPPRFAEGEKDKELYSSIGESDRMTLKFIKIK